MVMPDHLSMITTPVQLVRDGEAIGDGTGFFWAVHQDKKAALFVITNYHMLTGVEPGKPFAPSDDSLTFEVHTSTDDPSKVSKVTLPLYTRDNTPVYLTSATVPTADVGILPLPASVWNGLTVTCLDEGWARTDMLVLPTSLITVVGYPYRFRDETNKLPIYKTGSIGSEPEYDFGGLPVFLVDVSAFKGMSGSPVFAVSRGGVHQRTGGAAVVGNARRFLGIFASIEVCEEKQAVELTAAIPGLAVTHIESMQLGYVWKANVIIDILKDFDASQFMTDVQEST